MHEMAIAQGIFEIVSEAAADSAARRVSLIKLQIGRLTAIEPETLRFCFASLAAGTIAEEAILDIEVTPVMSCCRECKQNFSVEELRFVCPNCGSCSNDIISGRELRVEHLEVE